MIQKGDFTAPCLTCSVMPNESKGLLSVPDATLSTVTNRVKDRIE